MGVPEYVQDVGYATIMALIQHMPGYHEGDNKERVDLVLTLDREAYPENGTDYSGDTHFADVVIPALLEKYT